MSQLAGVFYFDLRPISGADKVQACRCFDSRNHGGIHVYDAPGVLLLSSAGRFDVQREHTLSISDRGNVCLWDGRLDNPGDLLTKLGPDTPQDCADGDLALRMYEARGVAGLGDLIGDWSMVIWDIATRSMFLASDYAGVRPLFYHRAADRLLWSSSLKHLVRWSGADDLDDEYIAEFLTRGLAAGRTPYRGVYPVPAGAAIRVTENRLLTQAFWSFPAFETRYPREQDYEERLRILFREAVGVRLKTSGPAAAELSGGLDSSSVVCFANSQIGSRAVAASKLVSFSYCSDGSADERYFRVVEEHCGLSGNHLDISKHPFITREHTGESAPQFWETRLIEVSRYMAEAGAAVLLTGQLGDLVMGNWLDDSEQVAGLLQHGQFSAALGEAFAWSRSLRVPVHSILWRALQTSVFSRHSARNNLDLSSGLADQKTHGNSLTVNFRRRVDDWNRKRTPKTAPDTVSPACRKRFWALNEALSARVLQCPERLQHICCTHPFAHRPLVEFMMTVPDGVVCRPGAPRRLMRRAFAGLVPDTVLKRRSKTPYSGVFRQALVPLANELLEGRQPIHLVEQGYLDAAKVRNRLSRFQQGLDCNAQQLRFVILLEFWLRSRAAKAAQHTLAGESCFETRGSLPQQLHSSLTH